MIECVPIGYPVEPAIFQELNEVSNAARWRVKASALTTKDTMVHEGLHTSYFPSWTIVSCG